MNVREITTQDLDALCHLFIEVFKQDPWNEEWKFEWAKERLTYILSLNYSNGLMAEKSNEVVGAILGRGMPFKGRLNFEVVELFVSPRLQNQGIGTKLMTALEQILTQANYRKVVLLTARDSTPELFYQRRGYKLNEQISFMSKVLAR